MSSRPVKMAPELRTSLLTETVLAAMGVGGETGPLARVVTTGPYTASISTSVSPLGPPRWADGLELVLTTCVGSVSQAVVSASRSTAFTEETRKVRGWRMERLAGAIGAEPGVTEAILDGTYKTSVLVRLSYGRLRIIREGSNA